MRRSLALLCGLVLVCQGLLAGSVVLSATGSGTQRWRDTVDHLYNPMVAEGHAASFYDGATVTVTYDNMAPTFAGTLVATGLKPHSVYQVKLDGAVITADFDDQSLASEALGYAGRWWLSKVSKITGQTVSAWNSTDAEYEKWEGRGFQDRRYYYMFNGYLMFDYFVTDRLGAATLTFSLDSSYHVLWKDSQLNPPPSFYYPLDTHTIDPDLTAEDAAGVPWYTVDYPATEVTIYGEIEHEDQDYNDQVGETVLPEGIYPVTFMLTEESFHSTLSEGGSWAGVLVGDVQFTVGTIPVNHAPVASPDAYSLTEGITALGVSLPGVLGNDSDPDGDALAAVLVTDPTNGTVTLNSNGSFTYDVPGGFVVGTDYSFTYKATDGELQSNVATVTITVNSAPANVAPTADAGADQAVADDDGDGVELVTLNGTASSDSDGTIGSYVWSEEATDLGSGATLVHSFPIGVHSVTLTVTDDDGATATDTVLVTVNERQPPAASLVVAHFLVSPATAGVNNYATAAATVEDGNGTPVAGATVTLRWSVLGKVSTNTGITAVDGTVSFTSAKTKKSGVITATITDVRTPAVTEWSDDLVANPQSVTVP